MKFLPRFWIFFSDENQFGGESHFGTDSLISFPLKNFIFIRKLLISAPSHWVYFFKKLSFGQKLNWVLRQNWVFHLVKKTWINWGKLCGTASQLKSILLFFIQYLLEIWICWKFYFKTKLWSKIHKNQDI